MFDIGKLYFCTFNIRLFYFEYSTFKNTLLCVQYLKTNKPTGNFQILVQKFKESCPGLTTTNFHATNVQK